MPRSATVTVSFTLPEKRRDAGVWLSQQQPDTIADILTMSETIYSAIKSGGTYTDISEQHHAKQIKTEKAKFEIMKNQMCENFKEQISDLETKLSEKEIEQQHIQTTLKERNREELSTVRKSLKEQIHELETKLSEKEIEQQHFQTTLNERNREELSNARKSLSDSFENRIHDQEKMLDRLREENKELILKRDLAEIDTTKQIDIAIENHRTQWHINKSTEIEKLEKTISELSSDRSALKNELEKNILDQAAVTLHHKTQFQMRMCARESELEQDALERIEKTKECMATENTTKIHDLQSEKARLLEDLKNMNGTLAVQREQVTKEYQCRLDDMQSKAHKHHEDHEAQLSRLRTEKDDKYNEMVHQWEDTVKELQNQRSILQNNLQQKEEAMQTLRSTQQDELMKSQEKVLQVVSRLTGNTTTIGQIGENFVFDVQSSMQLGILTPCQHIRLPGHGDYTWTYNDIIALLEVKFGKTDDDKLKLHSIKDIEKFETDVKSAHTQGRINAAMIISTEKRSNRHY